jgi:DNA-binding transcriptional regulator YhcF (GntR family)
MNYDFTDDVRRALGQARLEAIALRHDYIGTEHILLGLIVLEETPGARILRGLGVRLREIRKRTEASVRAGKGVVLAENLPYTSRAKKVLEYAMTAAREMRDASIGTEHLLLGIMREEKGIAAQVVNSVGVSRSAVERAARDLRDGVPLQPVPSSAGASAETEEDVWFLEVDPASSVPIYEQIIARIEEAVATGRLVAGERLPPVRDLAEELGVAPGTVARAYGVLERKGVLETSGSRGTHVAGRTSSPAGPDTEVLEAMLRPVVVSAFHMGADAARLRDALERAMRGIYPDASKS